ncbi:uncharacterized protein LOC125680959 [Ostrea edulis]|uniref:uncharacterized protein LOC125680959 n=1 Tax=Ostrea edulis TaxID=37623 RepID=UPI0024AFBF98|nr:uncharacterized protein LOC125680959 [Ostrea edulis]
MIRGNSKQKIKTTRQAVAIEKSTGAKKVVSTQRNDCDLKNHDGDLKKLMLEDQECNKLLLSVKDSKRQRQMKVEEQQKNLAEARKYHKVLISRKMTQAKKIKSVNKTVGRGVPLHASQEDILLHEMLVTQERIQRSKVKVLETELSALSGLPPRSTPMLKLQRPKPAFKIPNLVFRKVENDSLPPVGVQEKVKYSDEVYDPEKGLGKRKEFTVPVACVHQVPPLDLSKLLDDSLSAVGKRPTVPAVCGQKGRKLIASGNCAARQNMTKDHDNISRSVVFLPDIKDNDKTKFFIPNIFNCKSIL